MPRALASACKGYAIADRAYQSALEYAKERVQSRDVAARNPQAVRIIEHPDVRRMLMSCKSQLEAMRALSYVTAASLDFAHTHPDEAVRKQHKAYVELMIPVVKAWCTETAQEVASTALQVFGGIGYIEETGIAQQYRDVRITSIYEGTTGIQALDLVGRKLIRDMGATATTVIKSMKKFTKRNSKSAENEDVKYIRAGARQRHRRACRSLAMDRHERDGRSEESLRVFRALPQAVGHCRGRPSDGARGANQREKIAARRRRSVLCGEDHDGALLRRSRSRASARSSSTRSSQGAGDVMTLTEEQFELDRKSPVVA